MKKIVPVSQGNSSQPKLVWICAWCYPPGNEAALPEGEAYTHGICKGHLKLLENPKKYPMVLGPIKP